MKFFKFWMLLFLAGVILPSNARADCGSYIYISGSSSNQSSDPDPSVNSSISLPDFIVKKIWLTDSGGNTKTTFTQGEAMQVHVKVKNVGVDAPAGIDLRYYLSDGYKKDSSPKKIGSDSIDKDDLKSGQTHSESKSTTAPSAIGVYNMTVKADTGNDVLESNEKNNWSDTAVFTVTPPNYAPVGNLENNTCNIAEGWASDPNTTNPIYVNVYAGDANGNNQVFQTTVYANIFRIDNGNHGFLWSVPNTLKTGLPFTLFFYAVNVPAGNNPLIGQTQLTCVGQWFNFLMDYVVSN